MNTATEAAGTGYQWRRLLITLAMLAAYRLASFVPLAGVNVDRFMQSGTDMWGGLPRISIMAIGILPWMSALMLAELVVLLLPDNWTRKIRDRGHANPFALPIIAVALAFAAFQGYGVSSAMQQVSGMVAATDFSFTLIASTQLVCGTALAMVLARIIQVSGLGPGFWVLIAAFGVSDIAVNAQRLLEVVRLGAIAPHFALGLIGATLVAVAAIIWLAMMRQRLGLKQMESLVWPILLAGLVLPWLAIIVGIGGDVFGNWDRVQTSLSPYQPIGLLVFVLLIAGFSLLYARKENSLALWVPTTGVLAVLVISLALERTSAAGWLLSAGHLVIVTTVAYVLVTGFWQGEAADTSVRVSKAS